MTWRRCACLRVARAGLIWNRGTGFPHRDRIRLRLRRRGREQLPGFHVPGDAEAFRFGESINVASVIAKVGSCHSESAHAMAERWIAGRPAFQPFRYFRYHAPDTRSLLLKPLVPPVGLAGGDHRYFILRAGAGE